MVFSLFMRNEYPTDVGYIFKESPLKKTSCDSERRLAHYPDCETDRQREASKTMCFAEICGSPRNFVATNEGKATNIRAGYEGMILRNGLELYCVWMAVPDHIEAIPVYLIRCFQQLLRTCVADKFVEAGAEELEVVSIHHQNIRRAKSFCVFFTI